MTAEEYYKAKARRYQKAYWALYNQGVSEDERKEIDARQKAIKKAKRQAKKDKKSSKPVKKAQNVQKKRTNEQLTFF